MNNEKIAYHFRQLADEFEKLESSNPTPQPTPHPTPTGDLVDIDGNTYNAVQIGSQVWSAENFRCSRLANGEPIDNVKNPSLWKDKKTPSWSHYDNDSRHELTYGKLYNWYALNGLAPQGWRVATDNDFKTLERHLGMKESELNEGGHRGHYEKVGTKLKSTSLFRGKITDTSLNYYNPDFVPATNETGFTGVPNGSLNPIDTTHNGAGFYSITRDADIWTMTEHNEAFAWTRALSFNQNTVFRAIRDKRFGMAVRLIKE